MSEEKMCGEYHRECGCKTYVWAVVDSGDFVESGTLLACGHFGSKHIEMRDFTRRRKKQPRFIVFLCDYRETSYSATSSSLCLEATNDYDAALAAFRAAELRLLEAET